MIGFSQPSKKTLLNFLTFSGLKIGILNQKFPIALTEFVLNRIKLTDFTPVYFDDDEQIAELLGHQGRPFYDLLQEALAENEIDGFVQPFEGFPLFPKPHLHVAAVYPRQGQDVISTQVDDHFLDDSSDDPVCVSVASKRVETQWRNCFRHHHVELTTRDTHDRLHAITMDECDAGVFNYDQLALMTFEQYIDRTLECLIPAAGQMAYGLICKPDTALSRLWEKVGDKNLYKQVLLERAVLKHLGLKEEDPVGVHVTERQNELKVDVWLSSEDVKQVIKETFFFASEQPSGEIAAAVVGLLHEKGAAKILKTIKPPSDG